MAEEQQRTQERTRDMEKELDRLYRDRYANDARTIDSSLIFFPPRIPFIGTTSPPQEELAYPAILADYAGEPFFMAHGSLRLRNRLKPTTTARIERYRHQRDELVDAIRTKLESLQTVPWAQRRVPLAELADRQKFDLQKLEAEAEAIRLELCLGDDGAALARQRDGLKADQPAALQEYLSLLLAAQYHAGLSLEQRQLLLEIAADALGPPAVAAPSPFFLPAGARMQWPARLPPEVAAHLARFGEMRAALKTALRAQVLATPEKTSTAQRTKAYTTLADRQAARFAELHALAEEIRVALADQSLPGQPAGSTLPENLTQRVGQAVERNAQLRQTARRHLQEFNRALAPERVKLGVANQAPQLEVLPPADAKAKPRADRGAAVARLQAANEQLRQEYAALAAEMEATRIAVQLYRDTLPAPAPSLGQLNAQLARTYAERETWKRFRDYRDAVLTPGLSPAQRRLLFNAALVHLEKHRLESAD